MQGEAANIAMVVRNAEATVPHTVMPMTASRCLTERARRPDHDQGLAGTDLEQQARRQRPGAIGTGGVLLLHRVAAGSAPLVEWGLLFGGHPRIADQAT